MTITLRVLIAVGVLLLHSGAQAQSARPILIMISIDGLRPDYVTAADTHGLKIPNLRRFLAAQPAWAQRLRARGTSAEARRALTADLSRALTYKALVAPGQ